MSGVKRYIEKPTAREVPVFEAIFVTGDNYQEVALWMGYNDIRSDGKDGWLLKRLNTTYHLSPNTYIINRAQTMSKEKFEAMYDPL